VKKITDVLRNFPKIRQDLPEEYSVIYTKYYQDNRGGKTLMSSLAQRMESWMHRQVASDVNNVSAVTLEVGAGNLNQLEYESVSTQYDIVEPFTDLYKSSPLLSRIRSIYNDVSNVPNTNRYNRITSIATFEHIWAL